MGTPLLEVRNLRVEFPTRQGTLCAVDDLSFEIAPGEMLGVVGESGAGKSLTGMAIIGLLERPGRIAAGEIRLEGERIDNLPAEAMRRIRGKRIGAIFQDPLTSLNPLFTIGEQLVETIDTHLQIGRSAARRRAIVLLAEVGIPAHLVGKTSLEANLRKEFEINVIAVKPGQQEDFQYFSPEYKFGPEDVAIVAGNEDRIVSFTGSRPQPAHRKNAQKTFGQLFPKRKSGKAVKH